MSAARIVAIGLATLSLLAGTAASAQTQQGGHAAGAAQGVGFRGFGDIGGIAFTAADSFTAVLGSKSGVIFGGGVEVVLPQRIFAGVRVSRFQKTGQRVFVSGGDVFDLGIEDTVTIMPIEVSGGYRFGSAASRVVPYLGGGIGWHRYKETSDFAVDGDDVDETHQGYHVLGGAEFRITRWLGAAGEAQWTTVPDGLGQDPNSVSAAFGETDLGGATFRVKIVVGR